MLPVYRDLSVPPRNRDDPVVASLKANVLSETAPWLNAVLKKGVAFMVEMDWKPSPRILRIKRECENKIMSSSESSTDTWVEFTRQLGHF